MRRAAALGLALWLIVPNEPANFWYAAPEYACGLTKADEDQWQCDSDPVAFTMHDVASSERAKGSP
jgi:hypothetical protein